MTTSTPTPPPPPPPPRPPLPEARVAPNAGAPTPHPLPPPVAAPTAAAGARSSLTTMTLVGIGSVVVAGIALIGGLAVFGGGDSSANTEGLAPTTAVVAEAAPETTVVEATVPATTIPATTVAPTTAPPTTAAPETTLPPVTTVAPATTIAPATTVAAAPSSTPIDPNVEESKAVVRGGQIFLTGAVPTVEAGQAIEALAAEILGPQNVFNNYVVDPGAGDPNLGNITVEDTITFATGSASIQGTSIDLLNQGLALMNIRPAMTITVVGHTDSRGTPEGNLDLSLARAEAVKAWFVERGIDPARLTTEGMGQTEPIGDNATEDGRRQNRRIQFFLENILG